MKQALGVALLLAACPGDEPDPPPAVDAPAGTIDSPLTIDAPANVCTGQFYDRCTNNNQCMSGVCRMFNNLGMLCTQTCVPGGAACPMQGTTAVPCTTGNSNVCRPAAANTCTPQP